MASTQKTQYSSLKEERKAWRVKYLSNPENLAKHKARMRAHYLANKEKILVQTNARHERIRQEKLQQNIEVS